MREGPLHAEPTLEDGTRRPSVGCRPSDALAPALRKRAPIAVASEAARVARVLWTEPAPHPPMAVPISSSDRSHTRRASSALRSRE